MKSNVLKILIVALILGLGFFAYKKIENFPKSITDNHRPQPNGDMGSNQDSGDSSNDVGGDNNRPSGSINNGSSSTAARLEAQKNELLKTMAKDRNNLNKVESDFNSFSFALMRLSTHRDSAARDKALELIESKDKKISSLAFRALGYFDEAEVNEKLADLIQDENKETREKALFALNWNPQPGSAREEILLQYLKSINKSSGNKDSLINASHPESLTIISSLYRMTNSPDQKKEYIDQVEKLTRDQNNSSLKQAAIQTLKKMK